MVLPSLTLMNNKLVLSYYMSSSALVVNRLGFTSVYREEQLVM